MRKVLRQNLRVRQGLAALGLLSATYWASRALRKRTPAAQVSANDAEEAGRLRERLAVQSRELLRLDHELRTPIGAARAALEILQSATDDEDLQAEARRVIARQLARMTALTEELRGLAQRYPD
ncbi:histidine kinase dimerization/phospho-acceptor domain-containing protein [Variovorax sp. HW608]|uniref:histidine kinase dimerization/phospho-acceptor domain-containing protein n=1 Tax=Variovorax sp. HW608 TaxID=1034889 RepID=UPI000B5AE076|nr:histidine kinase dimerization/phospho-acceptor domain-containing protein [Variovorax sp. HW608]